MRSIQHVGTSSMNSSKMNVDSVDSRPRNILMQPTATKAVLGTLNKYETGYIIGVIAQLPGRQHAYTNCTLRQVKIMSRDLRSFEIRFEFESDVPLFSSLPIKLPSAEASKQAQCTSPGQYAPYIKGIMKTP